MSETGGFVRPRLSAVFTGLVFLAGHLLGSVRALIVAAEQPALGTAVEIAYRILPSLHRFDVRNQVLSGSSVPPEQLAYTLGYAGLYAAAVLALTVVVFGRRDFE